MADGQPTDDEPIDGEPTDDRPTDDEAADVEEPRSDDDRDADIGRVTERRPLRRSTTDRVIAGVAGGIGAYFGIDAVIVRIGFIVLTFLGGAGPFLYLIGWLALPSEDSPSVIAKALGGDSSRRFRSLAAVVLIGLGLLMTAALSEDLFRLFGRVWTAAPYLALMLIAVGVALVLWPGPARRSRPPPARRPTPLPAPPPHALADEPEPVAISASQTSAPTVPSLDPVASRHRQRSVMGPLTIAVLFVYTGAAVILDRLDAIEVEIGVYFAIALAITGIGLAISAFARPARGLIAAGAAILAPVLLFSGTDVVWGSGVGQDRVSVIKPDDLAGEYRHGVGRLIVDLRDFESDGSTNSLAVSVGIGEALVYVPDNLRTIADVDVGVGDISVSDRSAFERLQDVRDIRYRLEDLQTLPFSEDDDLDSLAEYLDAYESYSGHRITPFERQILERRLPDGSGLADRIHPRDALHDLLLEANAGDQRQVGEDGLGLTRRVTTPTVGEPTGELRLDIDIGIGRAELVIVPAPIVEKSP